LHPFEHQQTPKSLTHPGEGFFSKPCVETPSDENRLGSLMIIFPTPHDCGILSLRSRNYEQSFDPSRKIAAAAHPPPIGYVVLLKDIEHEVAPIISGHRVTLTYDLYTEADDNGALLVAVKD
jgi:hypothetical protein